MTKQKHTVANFTGASKDKNQQEIKLKSRAVTILTIRFC